MGKQITVEPLYEFIEAASQALSELLIEVVEDGASVGFLPPLATAQARDYWSGVHGPGVLVWGAFVDGVLAGTVQLHLAMKANGAHRAEIAKLMVRPAYRRQGLARRLMEAAEAEAAAQGRTLLVLDTREGDPSNLLYQALGYMEAGRIPMYAVSANGLPESTVLYYKLTSG